jgi:hypothetical protein
MSRIYTEIRIAHKTEDEKALFELSLTAQVLKLGLTTWADYIRLIKELDAATGIISALKDFTTVIEQGILNGSGGEPAGLEPISRSEEKRMKKELSKSWESIRKKGSK